MDVKILSVIMNIGLRYREHIARVPTKGLEATMKLKRLRGLTPATARQLFMATVAPVVDYASDIWRHRCKDRTAAAINRVQKIGAQAIIGAFITIATSVAEAEAHIASAPERFTRRAIKLWTDLHALPETNPLRKLTSRIKKFRRFHRSPFFQPATSLNEISMEDLETVNPFTLPPWMERVQIVTEWNDEDATLARVDEEARCASLTAQNSFSGELVVAAYALRFLPQLRGQTVTLLTSNKAAVLTLRNPRQQSGQEYGRCIYEEITRLREAGNAITIVWLPSRLDDGLLEKAKGEARKASRDGASPEKQFPKMRSTTLNAARRKLRVETRLPDDIGKLSKEADVALPSKHTRELYDNLSWRPGTQRDNISFHLGGKTTSDGDDWKPDMKAVRATIRFAKATGRLENV
ncbi:reverse transcriptase [Verticillium dahliae]